MRAVVIFQDEGNHFLDPILKRGFRHVGIGVECGDYWVVVDPRNGCPVIEVAASSDYDLAGYYRELGRDVVELEAPGNSPVLPLALSNCVGVVKAILGLTAPFVFTPWQLYRRLTR